MNPTNVIKTLKKAPKPVVFGVIIGGLGLGYLVMRNFSASNNAPPQDTEEDTAPIINGVDKLNPGVIPVWAGDYSPSDKDILPRRDAPIHAPWTPITITIPKPIKTKVPDKNRTPTKPLPPPKPQNPVTRYPGLPDNWRLNVSEIVSRANLDRSFDDLLNTQKRIKPNDGIWWGRQLTSIAVQGAVSPWRYAPEVINAANGAIINQTRVKWGLFPLTSEQLKELETDSRNLWQNKPTIDRARFLFDKYNYPYQIANNGTIRRGR